MRANPMRYLVLAALLLSSCKEKAQPPPPPPEVQLSTDLPEGMIETVLKLIERNGGPRAARVPGLAEAGSALRRGPARAAPGRGGAGGAGGGGDSHAARSPAL